jgi:hypothetical protein
VLLHIMVFQPVDEQMGRLLQDVMFGQPDKSPVGNLLMAAENYCIEWPLSWLSLGSGMPRPVGGPRNGPEASRQCLRTPLL